MKGYVFWIRFGAAVTVVALSRHGAVTDPSDAPLHPSGEPAEQRTIMSLWVGTRSMTVSANVAGKGIQAEETLYWLDVGLGPDAAPERLWQESVLGPEVPLSKRSNFVCFFSEADGRTALAFTQGCGVRFVEADATRPLAPTDAEGGARAGDRVNVVRGGPRSVAVNVPLPEDEALRHRILTGQCPPKTSGIARAEGRWILFVEVGREHIALARTDGEQDWVVLGGPLRHSAAKP